MNSPNKTANRAPLDDADGLSQPSYNPLAAALAGSMMQPAQPSPGTSLSVPEQGSRKILGFFDTAATRRHRNVLEYIRDVAGETAEAQSLVAFLSDAFLTYNFESEAVAEQLLKQYAANPVVLSAAPTLIQIARQMRIENMVAINQAGQAGIRNKIEHR